MHPRLLALLLSVVVTAGGSLPSVVEANDDAAEQAIRQAGAAYREALTKGDIEAVAAFWTKNADFVDQQGRAYQVQPGLERAKKAAEQGAQIAQPPRKSKTLSIRFVTPEVALEDGVFERPDAGPDQSREGRYTAVWVKRDGRWLLDGERETPVRVETSSAPLEALAWMVGEWTAAGEGMKAELTCTWGPDKTYLLRQIKFERQGEPAVSATQWIGWDPHAQRIKSFLFDSRGGFGDANWTNEGDAWVVRTHGVIRDGKRTAATMLYSRVDDNTWTMESLDDEVDGQPGPEINLRVTRRGAAK